MFIAKYSGLVYLAIYGTILEFQTHSTRLADALRAEGKDETQVDSFLGVIMDLESTVGGTEIGDGILTPLEGALVRYTDHGTRDMLVQNEVLEEMRRLVMEAGMKEEEIMEVVSLRGRIVCAGCWTVWISKTRMWQVLGGLFRQHGLDSR
jgi:hypothetical protein